MERTGNFPFVSGLNWVLAKRMTVLTS